MARGVNKVILIGNLGNDPDTRFTPQGTAVTNLSIATDESYKDKQTGQMVPKTEWHRVVLFNRLAEIAKEYLKKGSKVYLEGRLQTRKWQDQSGQDRYTTEIVGSEMQMLDSRQGAGGGYDQSQGGQAAYAPSGSAPQQAYSQPQSAQGGGMQGGGMPGGQAPQGMPQREAPAMDDFDDDIPF